jgi:Fic family protein
MKIFEYSFLEHGVLPAKLINITNTISELKTLEIARKNDFPGIFAKLESIAKIQSVKDSNEIEGIITSDQRINEIVTQNSAPLNHNEEEIAGYRDALSLIHNNYAQLDICEDVIRHLHKIMLSYSPTNGGSYKESNNIIIEVDNTGKRHARFHPIPATETAEAMEQLILAYADANANYNVNQLILIPCFILDFLCIHPFADGNGRISRLLSLLLLYKNGFNAGKYVSFEAQINRTKTLYYTTLKTSSPKWHDNKNTYSPFIENFVSTLLLCYKELDKHFAVINNRKTTKKQRVEATVLNNLLPISKQEICSLLPDISPITVEAALSSMLKRAIIKKIGAARFTKNIKS